MVATNPLWTGEGGSSVPDLWTHIIYGNEIMGRITDSAWRELVARRQAWFDLGCQGPDLFFYYNFWPWKKGTAVGELLHHGQTTRFFMTTLRYARDYEGPDCDGLRAYLLGFLCHFAVDVSTHPYIHHISGIPDPDHPELVGNHKRIEAAIDVLLAREKSGLEPHDTPVRDRLWLGPELPTTLSRFYQAVLPEVLPAGAAGPELPRLASKSYSDMMKALALFHDPLDRKRCLLGLLDPLLRRQVRVSVFFYPWQVDAREDLLNEGRAQWCHPQEPETVSRASLRDLLDQAVHLGTTMVEAAIAYWSGEANANRLRQAIPNLSYSTARDPGGSKELPHCRPKLPIAN